MVTSLGVRQGSRHPSRPGTAKLALILLAALSVGEARAAGPVPFVSCPAEGMSGPVPAPAVPPADAGRSPPRAGELALYAAAGMSVLAPRGWHCLEIYDSGGAFLLVTPRPYTAATLPDANRLAGPAVELSLLSGENSGRDLVAAVFSRLFPSKRRFVRGVAEGDDTPPRYPRGPFRTDRTVRRGRTEVDYTTPPFRAGMGTFASRLAPGPEPITGAAILAQVQGVDSVVLLNVRLPPGLRGLGPVILRTALAAQMKGEHRASN